MIDLDSTICEVHGHHQRGAGYGSTRQLGDHPLLASRADTGEVLHARQRTGRAASGRGAERFVTELAGRIRRAGASGPLILRADSGFWATKVLAACRRHDIRFSITVRQTSTVTAATWAIPEQAWTEIDDSDGGIAQVAETTLGDDRLIVRRTRLTGPKPPCGRTGAPRLRHRPSRQRDHPGRRPSPPRRLRAGHPRPQARRRAAPRPSGSFLANAAWLVITTLATTCCAGWPPSGWAPPTWWSPRPAPTPPGRARPPHPLGPPAPAAPTNQLAWAEQFLDALACLRALPPPA
jgi:Transposase DDE domain group 1